MLFHGLTMGFFFYLTDVCVCVSGHVCVQIRACVHSCMSVLCVCVCVRICVVAGSCEFPNMRTKPKSS